MIAKVNLASGAKIAMPAINRGIEGDSIANCKSRHTVSKRSNYTCSFMSHDDRRQAPPSAAVVAVHIAATDAACPNRNQEVSRARYRTRHFSDFKVLVA
jgi:hypothetical protein